MNLGATKAFGTPKTLAPWLADGPSVGLLRFDTLGFPLLKLFGRHGSGRDGFDVFRGRRVFHYLRHVFRSGGGLRAVLNGSDPVLLAVFQVALGFNDAGGRYAASTSSSQDSTLVPHHVSLG